MTNPVPLGDEGQESRKLPKGRIPKVSRAERSLRQAILDPMTHPIADMTGFGAVHRHFVCELYFTDKMSVNASDHPSSDTLFRCSALWLVTQMLYRNLATAIRDDMVELDFRLDSMAGQKVRWSSSAIVPFREIAKCLAM